MTKYAEEILRIIMTADTHPTAEQIYMQMKMDNSKISYATVYNNLHTLAENGKIIRISEPGSPDRYDNTSRHDHLICTVCGKISDIYSDDLTSEIEKNLGQRIDSYDLRVRGVCPDCRNKIQN